MCAGGRALTWSHMNWALTGCVMWGNCFTSLSLRFLICKMDILSPALIGRDPVRNYCPGRGACEGVPVKPKQDSFVSGVHCAQTSAGHSLNERMNKPVDHCTINSSQFLTRKVPATPKQASSTLPLYPKKARSQDLWFPVPARVRLLHQAAAPSRGNCRYSL